MQADLECTSLTKRFGGHVAVDDVSFSVPPGSFFSILGPSGCGKTTIMRMIAGFLEPSQGDILIRGKSVLDVPPNKRPVNMVFQHLALFPMMNVADNIAYGLRRKGLDKQVIARKVGEVLERIDLPGIENRKIAELSGGQKQRVAIARCMVLQPDVLLLDEPLGALDLKLRERMKIELKTLQAAFDTTFVYITHDQSEALVMSDQIAVMNMGRFEQIGTARELFHRPETAFVAGFVGDSNKMRGKVTRSQGGMLEVITEQGETILGKSGGRDLSAGDQADVFVRPEVIRIEATPGALGALENRFSVTVHDILFNGAASRILVRTGPEAQEIEVSLPQTGPCAQVEKGDKLAIGWSAQDANCFATAIGWDD